MDKESFVLYCEFAEYLEDLTMEQRGILFTGIFDYVKTQIIPDSLLSDPLIKLNFKFIKNRLDKDYEKWQQTIDARRAAGSKGGRPQKANEANGFSENQIKAKKANGFSEKQVKAKKADHDLDHEYVLKENRAKEKTAEEQISSGAKAPVSQPKFLKPSREEVQAYLEDYCREKSLREPPHLVETFINHYESNGWKVSRNSMKDWHAAIRNWVLRANENNPNGFSGKNWFDKNQADKSSVRGHQEYKPAWLNERQTEEERIKAEEARQVAKEKVAAMTKRLTESVSMPPHFDSISQKELPNPPPVKVVPANRKNELTSENHSEFFNNQTEVTNNANS